jgi:hypothetical protein
LRITPTLPTHRQSTTVPQRAITVDRVEPLHVGLDLPAQVALDHNARRVHHMRDLGQLVVVQLPCPRPGVNPGLVEDLLAGAPANPVNIGKRSFDPLLIRDFNAK